MVNFCAKYLLCGFNFFIFLAGSSILSLGIWLLVDKNSFIGLITIIPNEQIQDFTRPGVVEQIAYIFISVGALMFTLSFLGYCGALRESQCMLTTYGLFLLIILILEVAVGCLAIFYREKAEESVKNSLKLSIAEYYSKGDAITLSWDKIQVGLHCCGVDNYTDYQKNERWSSGDQIVPESCCVLDDNNKPLAPTCTFSPNEANSYYVKGCFDAFLSWMMTHLNVVIAVAISFSLVEILGIFLAFYLAKSINRFVLIK